MSPKQLFRLTQESVNAWLDDYAPSMAAALSYYTLFSIAPLILIVVSVAGLVFGADAARGEIFEQLEGLMGPEGALAVQGLVQSANKPTESSLATVIGLVALLVGATTVFAELQSSLDRIWRVPVQNRPSGILGLLRVRLLSLGMIMGIGFLLMVSLVISAAIAALGKWWTPLLGGWEATVLWINMALSYTLVTAVFAMIYKTMPRLKIQWRDVWIGAAVTALMFTLGKFLIGQYIGRTGVASALGAAASLGVVLIWVYYSALIFFLGAEFTAVYARTHGSLRHLSDDAGPGMSRPVVPSKSEQGRTTGAATAPTSGRVKTP